MPLNIDEGKFQIAHEAFEQFEYSKSGGIRFTDFQHPFFVKDETAWKWKVYYDAMKALNLEKWEQWKRTPGKIVQATKQACNASLYFLDHKHGQQNFSDAALYRVSDTEQIKNLEHQLFEFFKGGLSTPTDFGVRFDAFAAYLGRNRLACKWDFISYLAFLLCPQIYFPIRATYVDALLNHYGVAEKISHHISWEQYCILLELAEILKSKLALYGEADAVQIQSYMWVIADLIKDKRIPGRRNIPTPNIETELQKRIRKAIERERIGLLGEKLIYEEEKTKLTKDGRSDLADKVKWNSLSDDNSGFDILSFEPSGHELHIEVKTTTRSVSEDYGFWLSQNERTQAEKDSGWVIYRVWNIDSIPSHENLGNIVVDQDKGWALEVSSWHAKYTKNANAA